MVADLSSKLHGSKQRILADLRFCLNPALGARARAAKNPRQGKN
jgi:hypothetical protein